MAALAQTPAAADLFEKAPPDVDQSLRERVREFYQHHIDGTYRKAEKLVADESQDFFYQIQKQRYESCEMIRIAYTENFTRATVTMACKGKWNISGNDMTVSMPLSSSWKRDNGGLWLWHHVIPQKMPTPFGEMDHRAVENVGKAPAEATGGLQIPPDIKAAGEMLLKQVKVDKSEVVLSSYEKASDSIAIANNSGGSVTLRFDYEAIVPGFKAVIEKADLGPGESTVLKLSIDPKDRVAKPAMMGRILVEPLLQQFPVKITFAIPPELEKQLPKMAPKK
jgi:hypothetical protein